MSRATHTAAKLPWTMFGFMMNAKETSAQADVSQLARQSGSHSRSTTVRGEHQTPSNPKNKFPPVVDREILFGEPVVGTADGAHVMFVAL